jgi:4,5-dihydroxyphthalate decarboxylase
MPLQLGIGLTANPRTRPVVDGRAKADGIDLIPTVLHPSELFWRQLHFAEFAVSEMSVSSLMIAKCRGDDRFVGLPIFTTRIFFHAGILVRRDAGIATPVDLKGKRVGIPEYQQTAALWIRGALLHEFGVAPQDMEFWMERPPARSHGGATGFKAPSGVTIRTIPDDKSIGSMMIANELDAALFYLVDANPIDRSKVDLGRHPDIKWLFPDRIAETVRYYRKTGLYPINHMMVVRKDVADKEPWVVLNVLKAFNQANDIAEAERIEQLEYHLNTGLLSGDGATRIVRHGVAANRKIIETIAQYSLEQGLTPRLVKLEELFSPNTMES